MKRLFALFILASSAILFSGCALIYEAVKGDTNGDDYSGDGGSGGDWEWDGTVAYLIVENDSTKSIYTVLFYNEDFELVFLVDFSSAPISEGTSVEITIPTGKYYVSIDGYISSYVETFSSRRTYRVKCTDGNIYITG